MSPSAIAKLAPTGTNPSTPRSNWDQCYGTAALTDWSYGAPTGDKYNRLWGYFSMVGVPIPPGSPPASNYVACTLSGPFFATARGQVLAYTWRVTDVASQPVYVAFPSATAKASLVWEHAAWRRLAPGQATVFVEHYRNVFTPSPPAQLLVRPSVAPKRALGYTAWVNNVINQVVRTSQPHPTGACAGLLPGSASGIASAPGGGYWVASGYGETASCGALDLNNFGESFAYDNFGPSSKTYVVSDPAADGYWLVSLTGQVDAFGGAHWYGQYGRTSYTTSIAATVSGKGYWLVTAYGKVLHYGDAPFYGSARIKDATAVKGGVGVVTPTGIVGITPTEGMHGYVLVAKDGAVYGFGKGRGAACGPVVLPRDAYVAGVAPDYRTGGYWVASTTGQVFACHAPNWPAKVVTGTVTGIGALGNGLGYRLVTSAGSVYDYGAALWRGNPD